MYRARPWTIRQVAGFGTAKTPTVDTSTCSLMARLACRPTSICRRFWAMTRPPGRDTGGRQDWRGRGYGGRCPPAHERHPSGSGVHLVHHQCVGLRAHGHVRSRGQIAGGPGGANHRHDSERHFERVHGAERIHLSAGAFGAISRRHHGVRRDDDAALQPGQRVGLSHPRRGLERGPGVGVPRWPMRIAT